MSVPPSVVALISYFGDFYVRLNKRSNPRPWNEADYDCDNESVRYPVHLNENIHYFYFNFVSESFFTRAAEQTNRFLMSAFAKLSPLGNLHFPLLKSSYSCYN